MLPRLADLVAEAYRLQLLAGLEDGLRGLGYYRIAGVDEVGRGCLAGPVVAAAVIPRPGVIIPGIDDSKAVRPEQRVSLATAIRESSVASAVVAIPSDWIDRVNILQATKQAMVGALSELTPQPDLAIVDAVQLEGLGYPSISPVRGDVLSYAVACASILAKVERDELMLELDRDYPYYGFGRHKGYAAPEHLEALESFGPSPAHRLTFRSVLPRVDAAVARGARA